MLIEIHMLQNHAPSNLNRDDTGSPKECIFAGVKRGRISSQCLKRSIRRSPMFHEELGKDLHLGSRTRRLPQLVQDRLISMGIDADVAAIAARKASGFGTKEGKEREADGNTAQTMFLSDSDVDAVVKVMHTAAVKAGTAKALEKVEAKTLQEASELRGWRPLTIDLALFGRMITSPAFQDVQASLQVAHAISVNKIDHEFDYFTAVDDLQAGSEEDEKGADMIGDVEFNSACYYKYFSIDLQGLVNNLAGLALDAKKATEPQRQAYQKTRKEAADLALSGIAAFLKAAIFTTPTGKQNTFAAHQLPDAVLIEVRPQRTPISYANAFVTPARASGERDLVDDSMSKLINHVDQITRKFSLHTADRLWFTTRDAFKPAGTPGTPVTVCDTVDDLLTGLKASIQRTTDGGTHG